MKTEHKIVGILLFVSLSISLRGFGQDTTVRVGPNPFADSTTIYLPPLNNDTVSLVVYDKWGRTLKTFYDKDILSGTIQVTFAADTLPNDRYFLQFILNGKITATSLIKVEQVFFSSVEKSSNNNGLKTYPNPASTLLNFESENEIINFSLFSLTGVLVAEFFKPISPLQLNLNLRSGMYVLRIESHDHIELKKIIIENRFISNNR